METKFQTLQMIYELVKNDSNPFTSIIHPNEIISRRSLPWDEIVSHLNELQVDGYIIMKQTSTAMINLTGKGFEHMASLQPVKSSPQ